MYCAAPGPAHDRATALLCSADYLHAKAQMEPIGQVLTLVDDRTAQESAWAVGEARAWSIGAVAVALVLELLHRVAATAHGATDLSAATREVLDLVCAYTGWKVSHVYWRDNDALVTRALETLR